MTDFDVDEKFDASFKHDQQFSAFEFSPGGGRSFEVYG